MPVGGTCVLCGRKCKLANRPMQLATSFRGIGVEGIRRFLARAGGLELHFAAPEGTVICFKGGGRACYKQIRDALRAVDGYTPRARRTAVREVDLLVSMSGPGVKAEAGGPLLPVQPNRTNPSPGPGPGPNPNPDPVP